VIVVDTNIVAYLLIRGDRTAAAEATRARDADWRVPPLFVHEWITVLAIHMRKGYMDRDLALRTYRRGLAVVKFEQRPLDALRILNLHATTGCSSYDCQFIDLAQSSNVRLVTYDGEILASVPGIAVDPASFVK
jgi:predicted nucleic acid-binding protein